MRQTVADSATVYTASAGEAKVVPGKEDARRRFRNGVPLSADELLVRRREMRSSRYEIPIKTRTDFTASEAKLPSSDLLKAFHYYVSWKSQHVQRYKRNADETALLACGIIVEDFIDELFKVGFDDVCDMYAEPVPNEEDDNAEEEQDKLTDGSESD